MLYCDEFPCQNPAEATITITTTATKTPIGDVAHLCPKHVAELEKRYALRRRGNEIVFDDTAPLPMPHDPDWNLVE